MVEEVLESEMSASYALKIEVRSRKSYIISPLHVVFFEKLTELPTADKIQLLGLTSKEMYSYIQVEKKRLQKQVASLLNEKWLWRETGDPVEICEDTIPGVFLSVSQMKSQTRSIETLLTIVEFFTGENREVYRENEK